MSLTLRKPSSTRPFLPTFLTPLLISSCLICCAVLGLSVVNFGLLSRWYNASAAIIVIISHLVLFFFAARERRTAEPVMVVVSPKTAVFPPISALRVETAQEKITDADLLPDSESDHHIDYPIAHTVGTIVNLFFLLSMFLIAFGIMADITRRGGKNSTLPGEREKGMTYPWNIKVQIAQTALVGTETLVLLVALLISGLGRIRIAEKKKQSLEEIEYGLKSAAFEDSEVKGRPF